MPYRLLETACVGVAADWMATAWDQNAGLYVMSPAASALRLAYALNQVLEERKLSQAEAARVLGVTQPKVSAPT